MKFLSLTTAFLFAVLLSNAQTEKGTLTLGANLGFSYATANNFTINVTDKTTSTLDTKTTGFNFGPNVSVFICNKLELGANVSYSSNNLSNNTENINTNNNNYPVTQFTDSFGASVFIRKYCLYKNMIGFRAGLYTGYSVGNQTVTYTTSNALFNYSGTSNYFSGGATLDLVYYPSKKLGVSAEIANLEYYHYKTDNTTQGHDSGDNFSLAFITHGVSLSIFYVFGR